MSGPKKLRTEEVDLGPALATKLLERNTLNRPISDLHVHRIARQIINGMWRFNGDTIKVAQTDDVLDGQHRLWAVIEAKMSIRTIIVYGIERDAFATIDTVRKLRSGGDTLALCGVSRYRNIASAALQWLIRWQRGVIQTHRAPENKVENSDVESTFTENPHITQAVERANGFRSLANPSIVGFFYYVLANRNPDLAERMMNTLEDPSQVAMHDPFFRLRAYFTTEHHKRKDPIVTIALMIKAANAAYRGEKLRALSWRCQGSRAEAFPTLSVGKQQQMAAE